MISQLKWAAVFGGVFVTFTLVDILLESIEYAIYSSREQLNNESRDTGSTAGATTTNSPGRSTSTKKTKQKLVVFPRRIAIVDDPNDPDERRLYQLLHQICKDTLASRAARHRYACSYCQRPIQGHAYVCSQCSFIRLCSHCERERIHDESHLLYQIKTPLVSGAIDPPSSQVPWTSDAHVLLEMERSREIPQALNFDEEIEIRKRVYYNLSLSDIDALYDQFRHLVDTHVGRSSANSDSTSNVSTSTSNGSTSPTNGSTSRSSNASTIGSSSPTSTGSPSTLWNFAESQNTAFSIDSSAALSHRLSHLMAISKERMFDILPTRYCSVNKRLQEFIVAAIYDCDKDGVISFPDFVAGCALATKSTADAKVDTLVRYLLDRTKSCSDVDRVKEELRLLFTAYVDLGHRAFADAMHLEQLEMELDDMRVRGLEPDMASTPQSTQPLSNLWDDRREIDTWTSFNPSPKDPVLASTMNFFWGMSIDVILTNLFDGMHTLDMTLLKKRFLSDPKFTGCVTSLFDAAII